MSVKPNRSCKKKGQEIDNLIDKIDGFENNITTIQNKFNKLLPRVDDVLLYSAPTLQTGYNNLLLKFERLGSGPYRISFPLVYEGGAGLMSVGMLRQFNQLITDMNIVKNLKMFHIVPNGQLTSGMNSSTVTNKFNQYYPNTELFDGALMETANGQISYKYDKESNMWYERIAGNIAIQTNETAGLSKGSMLEGRTRADTDGTNIVNGFDILKARITNAEINKLDKVGITSPGDYAYVTYGTPQSQQYRLNGIDSERLDIGIIPTRRTNRGIKVPFTPTNDDDAASKQYVDLKNDDTRQYIDDGLSNKVPKVMPNLNENKRYVMEVYGNKYNIQHRLIPAEADTLYALSVVVRKNYGHIKLPSTPLAADDAASKFYVDERMTNAKVESKTYTDTAIQTAIQNAWQGNY